MRYLLKKQVLDLCKKHDIGTPFRKMNLNDFLKDNNIQHHRVGLYCLINIDDFLSKINPKNITSHYQVPIVRTMQGAINEYNSTHNKKINVHTIERLRENEKIKYYKDVRFCLMNYKDLETTIDNERQFKRCRFKK